MHLAGILMHYANPDGLAGPESQVRYLDISITSSHPRTNITYSISIALDTVRYGRKDRDLMSISKASQEVAYKRSNSTSTKSCASSVCGPRL